MKRYAILLAAEEYRDFPPTRFCHNDAQKLKDTLLDYCDFAEQDILLELLGKDDAKNPRIILDQIKELISRSNETDTILFYYAGHGDLYDGDAYIILPSTESSNKKKTALPLRDISNILRLKNRLCVRLFDSCHSGSDVREADKYSLNSRDFARAVLSGIEQGWVTFASCMEDEYSYPEPRFQQGVFTHFLCETIREFRDEEEIFPEILKLKTCEKVKTWCIENKKYQTPTFNSSISGNVPIFYRIKKAIPKKDEDKEDFEEIKATISSRLLSLRALKHSSSKEKKENLTALIVHSKNEIELQKNWITNYGCTFEVNDPTQSDEIPEDLKKSIVRLVERKNLKPVHTVETYRERIQRSTLDYIGLSAMYLPRYETHYIVEQDYSWPKSYTAIEIKSDGYIPHAILFVYVIPLQIKAFAVVGSSIGGYLPDEPDWLSAALNCCFLEITDADKNAISEMIRNQVAKLNNRIIADIEKALNYLEWEIEQT